ncbi:hypothetical protein [Vibrio tritonius]|uniref:hypothetical protein n=1 Tax=Vibrio tritonius TaxID=1435069 RepID=UPI00315D4DFE
MTSYNVFYSIKDDVDTHYVTCLTQEFVQLLSEHDLVESVTCSKLTNKGNFPEMPDFHLAVNFRNQDHMNESFDTVRRTLMNEHPHSELMKSTKEFKVTFSESF